MDENKDSKISIGFSHFLTLFIGRFDMIKVLNVKLKRESPGREGPGFFFVKMCLTKVYRGVLQCAESEKNLLFY